VNGHERVLVRNGELDPKALESALITRRDLEEAIRKKSGEAKLAAVAAATLERDGEISLLIKSPRQ